MAKMKNMYIYKIFNSHYCKIVFILSLILVGIIIPKRIFYGYYIILGFSFIVVSSMIITCLIRNIKEKAIVAKSQKSSFVGILFSVIGLVAMNVCTVGAPVCGASLATGFLAILFPGIAMSLMEKYGLIIIFISLIIQAIALYFMNCFKKIQ